MSARDHWDRIYETKSPMETSWFAPHLQMSLDWILEAAPNRSASIIDVGGGQSTLADDLLTKGYRALTVLDISEAAIRNSQQRLGPIANDLTWLAGDVAEIALPSHAYDLWHDRAVFHFFTDPAQRSEYVRRLTNALKAGGQVLMATFGPEGPQKCSGLPTMRYDAESLLRELGPDFRLIRQCVEQHETPFGTKQQFLHCHFVFG